MRGTSLQPYFFFEVTLNTLKSFGYSVKMPTIKGYGMEIWAPGLGDLSAE